MIEDVDGNLFLDFTAGIAVCSTGHCHPRVVAAIQEQAAKLLHMSGTDFYYAPQGDLAKKLAEMAPGDRAKRVFFTNSGAESVEAAFKLARYHTGRQHMIAFFGAFHGRTMGRHVAYRQQGRAAPRLCAADPACHHVDYPERHSRLRRRRICDCARANRRDLFQRTVAAARRWPAIIVEPIQGEGGYIVPPPEFHRELRELCDSTASC